MTIWSWTSQKSLKRLKTKACWVLQKILKNEKKIPYPRVSNRQDFPLVNYSFFTTLPNLIQHPRWLILENLASVLFYSRLPVHEFMCTVKSGSMKPRQSHKTVWCTCFSISMMFRGIYRLRVGDFLSIC